MVIVCKTQINAGAEIEITSLSKIRKKQMATSTEQADRTTSMTLYPTILHFYILATSEIPAISLKGKDTGHFLLLSYKPIRLFSCLKQACEHIIYKYIFSSQV